LDKCTDSVEDNVGSQQGLEGPIGWVANASRDQNAKALYDYRSFDLDDDNAVDDVSYGYVLGLQLANKPRIIIEGSHVNEGNQVPHAYVPLVRPCTFCVIYYEDDGVVPEGKGDLYLEI